MADRSTNNVEKKGRADSIGASAVFYALFGAIMILNGLVLERLGMPPLANGAVALVIVGSAFIVAQRAMWAGDFSEARTIVRPAFLSGLVYLVALAVIQWLAVAMSLPALHWVQAALLLIVFFGIFKSFQS